MAYSCDEADGLYCVTDGSARGCAKLKGASGACNAGFEGGCTADTYCSEASQCVPRLPLGADCTHAFTADGDGCVAGAFCPIGGPPQCTPRAAEGASCYPEGKCLPTLRCDGKTCLPSATVGEDNAALFFACAGLVP